MPCCKETPQPNLAGDMLAMAQSLPIETFCCMARMAYTLAVVAEGLCLKTDVPPWKDLSDERQLALGEQARQVLLNQFTSHCPREMLFAEILRTMTVTA